MVNLLEILYNPLKILLLVPLIGIFFIFIYPYFRLKTLHLNMSRNSCIDPRSGSLCPAERGLSAKLRGDSETSRGENFSKHVSQGVGLSIAQEKLNKEIKMLGLFISILCFFISLYLWLIFDYNSSEFQFIFDFSWVNAYSVFGLNGFDFVFGLDGISLVFILLTTLLIPICLLSSWDSIKYLTRSYIICFLFLEFLLIGVFSILDIVGFYVFFEGILIPMFLIIGIWGSRKQKITAAYYFFFYTLIGSILMLLSLLYIYYKLGTTDYLTLLNLQQHLMPKITDLQSQSLWDIGLLSSNVVTGMDGTSQTMVHEVGLRGLFTDFEEKLLFLAFFSSLAVKIPKFPFHIWLPHIKLIL